jgi:hypothetical protein
MVRCSSLCCRLRIASGVGHRTKIGTWRSLVARWSGGPEAAGSSPAVPTMIESFQPRSKTEASESIKLTIGSMHRRGGGA